MGPKNDRTVHGIRTANPILKYFILSTTSSTENGPIGGPDDSFSGRQSIWPTPLHRGLFGNPPFCNKEWSLPKQMWGERHGAIANAHKAMIRCMKTCQLPISRDKNPSYSNASETSTSSAAGLLETLTRDM